MIDLTSYAAALLFFGTNLLRVIQRAEKLANHESMFQERPHYDLDPTYIQEQWVKRADGGTLNFVAGFLNTLAWLFLSSWSVLRLAGLAPPVAGTTAGPGLGQSLLNRHT